MSTFQENIKTDLKNLKVQKKSSTFALALFIGFALVLIILPFLGIGLFSFFGILYIANKIYDYLDRANTKTEVKEEKAL